MYVYDEILATIFELQQYSLNSYVSLSLMLRLLFVLIKCSDFYIYVYIHMLTNRNCTMS